MTAKPLALLAFAALTACVQPEMPPDGVIMPGPESEQWGMTASSIVSASFVPNADGTETVTVQFFSSDVTDDELAAAPALICESLPNVLSSEVRSPTAQEALADFTLMMIVTCGA